MAIPAENAAKLKNGLFVSDNPLFLNAPPVEPGEPPDEEPFNPIALSQPCVFWFDASDTASIVDDGGGLVSQITDKSGKENHATASTTARPTTGTRTIAGKNVLDFNGSSNSLILPSRLHALPAGENSLFIVHSNDNIAAPVTFLLDSAYGSSRRMAITLLDTTTSLGYRYPNTETRLYEPDDDPHCVGWVSGATTIPFFDFMNYDPLSVTRNAANAMRLMARYDGKANFTNGALAEVLIYSGAVTDKEKAGILNYLNAKWGLGVTQQAPFDTPFDIGVNIAGAEFDDTAIPGELYTNYAYPSLQTVDGFINAGCNVIRLPFRWERLQRSLFGEFDPTELGLLGGVARHITGRGAKCILDPHNYARYRIGDTAHMIGSAMVPESAYLDFMLRLTRQFADDPLMVFCLMNEPNNISAEEWAKYAQDAAIAIRNSGVTNQIQVPGTSWTGAHSWTGPSGNAEAFANFHDENFVLEMHQYLDSGSSGTGPDVPSEDIGRRRITSVTHWARQHGFRIHLGEFNAGDIGAAPDSTAMNALRNMMAYMLANADVWTGATMWAAGERWARDYYFLLQPDSPRLTEMIAQVQKHNAVLANKNAAE